MSLVASPFLFFGLRKTQIAALAQGVNLAYMPQAAIKGAEEQIAMQQQQQALQQQAGGLPGGAPGGGPGGPPGGLPGGGQPLAA